MHNALKKCRNSIFSEKIPTQQALDLESIATDSDTDLHSDDDFDLKILEGEPKKKKNKTRITAKSINGNIINSSSSSTSGGGAELVVVCPECNDADRSAGTSSASSSSSGSRLVSAAVKCNFAPQCSFEFLSTKEMMEHSCICPCNPSPRPFKCDFSNCRKRYGSEALKNEHMKKCIQKGGGVMFGE